MFRYVQEGNSLDYTPAAAVKAGDVIDVLGNGKLIGVAKLDIEAGILGAVDTGAAGGVYEAEAAAAIAKGDVIYADEGLATNVTSGTSVLFGLSLADAAQGEKVRVMKLGPQA